MRIKKQPPLLWRRFYAAGSVPADKAAAPRKNIKTSGIP